MKNRKKLGKLKKSYFHHKIYQFITILLS